MESFKKIVEDFRMLMSKIKKECLELDNAQRKLNDKEIIDLLENNYRKKIDHFYENLWLTSDYMKDGYEEKANYLMHRLKEFFVDNIETVTYIITRPLGYAGDFVTMNFIYDFNNGRYLGDNSYQKFINNYTCTIQVSNSNIGRKIIIKKEITKRINQSKQEQKILSLGSGSAREITELISEGKILKPVTFYCLDFEAKAIDFVKGKLNELRYDPSKIKIHFLHENLLNVIKKGSNFLPESSLDFVYISGVFDYFSQKVCQRILLNTLPLIKSTGDLKLLFFNMSLEKASSRAYYEMLGKWEMFHRTSDELINWEEEANGYKFSLRIEHDCPSYHIIEVK